MLCVRSLQGLSHSVACVFFFQAEDGIRDLVRSRGLGDVYKRQTLAPADVAHKLIKHRMRKVQVADVRQVGGEDNAVHVVRFRRSVEPVSYTHLTLPTSDLV